MKVLIVDDEQRLANGLQTRLSEDGHEAVTAYTGKQALAESKVKSFDVCILDIRLPDIDGIDLLKKLKDLQPTAEVVMLTGFASVDTAIESMKLGAYDYLTKPYKLSRLQNVIDKAYEKKSLKESNIILQERLQRAETQGRLVAESNVMRQVMDLVKLVAHSDVPTLVFGETGTGKELIARAIHDFSDRSANAFLAINSSALQESILENELFGHKRGAFTGAQGDKMGLLEIANKGTFFIDEIADMSPNIQAKLLRVLETGRFRRLGDTREIHVDVRFVCATNKNLDVEQEEGRFRKDLLYRLNAFTIPLPPLRERKDDIPYLTDHFLKKFARGSNTLKRISPAAMKLFRAYEWPGNIRELANVVERAILISSGRTEIAVDDLPQGLVNKASSSDERKVFKDRAEDIVSLEEMDKRYILHVLKLVGNNKLKATRLLDISRSKLYKTLAKAGSDNKEP